MEISEYWYSEYNHTTSVFTIPNYKFNLLPVSNKSMIIRRSSLVTYNAYNIYFRIL